MKRPLLLLTLPAIAAAAAPQSAARFQAPEVRVQGYRFVVEQVQQQQMEQIEFPAGTPADSPGKASGQQHLFFKLAVYPPRPDLLPHVEGLDAKVLGVAGDKSLTFRSSPVEDTGPLRGGVWRTQLYAQEVALSATQLSRFQGDLIVYPKARVVTLDFPLRGPLPATKDSDGMRATLRSVKNRASTLTVGLDIEWPASLSVTRLNPDSPSGVVAVTQVGSSLPPSGGSSSTNDRKGWVSRQHSLTFVDVKELPDKIRVEALVRSGAAQRIHFAFPDIPLPDTFDLAEETEGEEGSALEAGHPLYARGGGTLVAPLRGTVSGQFLFGLSRVEGGGRRWLSGRMEKDRAVLSQLQPGRYRVWRAWVPALSEKVPPPETTSALVQSGEAVEVEVAAGQTVTLPVVEVREAR